MSTLSIADSLKYANLQMAAEALYNYNAVTDGATLEPGATRTNVALDASNLTTGNLHASAFTKTQVELAGLTSDWVVVEHKSNTRTGFSGTLFRRIKDDPVTGAKKGEQVMSFRSTEFVDDAARDNQGTNALEIAAYGWAFGQIDDMRAWYASLGDRGLLHGTPSVTGYSLGGHLATVFNLLHFGGAAAPQVVTFNGAGVGEIKEGQGSLTVVLNYFRSLRNDPTQIEATITDPQLVSLYRELRSELDFLIKAGDRYQYNGEQAESAIKALKDSFESRIQAIWPLHVIHTATDLVDIIAPIDPIDFAGMLEPAEEIARIERAFDRAGSVFIEAHRVRGLSSGGTSTPAPIPDSSIAQESLDYQMAVLLAGERTKAISLAENAVQGYTGRNTDNGVLENQYDLKGAGEPSSVANSQIHYGTDIKVFVEDQPLQRGNVLIEVIKASADYFDLKLLVDKYAENDFGDTHSLVLILDSLNVQNTLLQLLPEAQRAQAQVTLSGMLRSASWWERDTDILGGGQGKAEGDVLENMVNALAQMVLGDGAAAIKLNGNPAGNTWHLIDDTDDAAPFSGREALYAALKQIQESDAYTEMLEKKVELVAPTAVGSAARHEFGQFLALYYLSPFALKVADQGVYDALKAVQGELADQWEHDRSLTLAQLDAGEGNFSATWLQDRADLLDRKLDYGRWNLNPVDPGKSLQPFYEDVASDFRVAQGFDPNDVPNGVRQYRFGGDGGDAFTGGNMADHFYGGAGNDTLKGEAGHDYLEGGKGNDHLYGGKGNDTLVGGVGNDRYVFRTGDGFDRIIDAGGQGSLQINDTPYTSAKQVAPHSNAWLSEDGLVRFTLRAASAGAQTLVVEYGNHDRILIQNFTLGDMGLNLEEFQAPETPPVPDFNEINGDLAPKDFSADPGVQSESDEWGNTIPSGVPEPDRKDGLRDTVDDDWIQGFGGEDLLRGGQGGNDKYDGGTADDAIFDGDGNDTLIGGEGADQLRAGAGDDQLFADDFLLLEDATVPNERAGVDARGDWLDGGADNDLLVGSKARDMLLGDEGDDTLVGGEGNDYLMGDGATEWLTKEWTVETMVTPLPDSGARYTVSFVDALALASLSEGGKDVLYGGAGNDWLAGNAGDDWLDGGSGFDLMWGGAGNDTLSGGLGNDVVSGDEADWEEGLPSALHGHDVLDGGEGHDSLNGNGGDDILLGGDGNDLLRGDDSNLTGRFGNAYLYHGADFLDGGAGDDSLQGGGRNDTLMGGMGKDLLVGDYADLEKPYHGGDLLDGGSENDTLFGMGGNDTLHGGTDDDLLFGDMDQLAADKHGDDWLYGGAGNDTLVGGGGTDWLYGGEDNDHLQGDSLGLTELEQHGDYLDGGQGNDTLLGMGGADTLFGGAGDDNLSGDAGDDVLDGGAGKDVLHGGAGNDRFIFANGYGLDALTDTGGDSVVQFGAGISADSLQIGVDEGTNRLYLSSSPDDTLLLDNYTGWGDTEFQFADGSRLGMAELMVRINRSVNQSGGNGVDRLYGANLNDALVGASGDDFFDGQGGADTLEGGLGNDSYLFNVGDGADVIRDREGANVVRFGDGVSPQDLSYQVTYMLSGSHVLNVQYEGGSIAIVDGAYGAISRFEFADGSALSLEQILAGAAGFTLTTEDIDSRVYGGGGADTLSGGRGNDSVDAQGGNDLVRGGAGNDWLQGAGGHDLLYGDAGDDHLLGGEGDDTLIGGTGNDTLEGGAGHNNYVFRRGMQRDVLLAQDGSANTLQIDPLLDVRDLSTRRMGDDLLIEYRYADDGVLIKDYYNNPQLWNVQSNAGTVQSMQDFLPHLINPVESDTTFYERQFQRRILEGFAKPLIQDGYREGDDGRFYKITTNNYPYTFREHTSIVSASFAIGEVENSPGGVVVSGRSVLLNSTFNSSTESRREAIEVARVFSSGTDTALPRRFAR